jgi:hypothetical protein
VTSFEFVFSLLVILLGLGLGQVLGGLASAVKRRPELKIGWGTGLLATWVTTETVIFWEIAWRARDALPFNAASLFAGLAITALYYFAGALVFPDHLSDRKTLDDYFMREKAKVIGALLAALALGLLLRSLILGQASWNFLSWWDRTAIALIFVVGSIALMTKRRLVAVGCLALLVVLDLLEPVTALI